MKKNFWTGILVLLMLMVIMFVWYQADPQGYAVSMQGIGFEKQ